MARAAQLLRCLALALLASRVAAISLVVLPNQEECVRQTLSPAHLPEGVHLPLPHSGRASFIVKGFLNQPHDSWGARLPSVSTRISGPKSDLWKRVTDFQFKDDVDFLGEGFGEYSLCVSLQSGAGAVAVEVNLFAPFVGMVDPRTVTDVAADGKDAKAVAEDVAMAESAIHRLKSDLKRIMNDQAYLKRRQLRHQQTLASSDKRAVAWSALECVVLVGLSGLQMVFFRRAFKNY